MDPRFPVLMPPACLVPESFRAPELREREDKSAFLICGRTSISNRAAARPHPAMRTYGLRKRFWLILRVIDVGIDGASVLGLAHDATQEAFMVF